MGKKTLEVPSDDGCSFQGFEGDLIDLTTGAMHCETYVFNPLIAGRKERAETEE